MTKRTTVPRYGIMFRQGDNVEIVNMDDRSAAPIQLVGESARRLVADFTDANEAGEAGHEEINVVQNWILKRAFEHASRATR